MLHLWITVFQKVNKETVEYNMTDYIRRLLYGQHKLVCEVAALMRHTGVQRAWDNQ